MMAYLLAQIALAWRVFLEGLDSFTEDFFPSGRNQGVETPRDSL